MIFKLIVWRATPRNFVEIVHLFLSSYRSMSPELSEFLILNKNKIQKNNLGTLPGISVIHLTINSPPCSYRNSPPWSYRNSPLWPYRNSPPWSYCNSPPWSNRRPNSPPWSYRNSPPWSNRRPNSPPWSYRNSPPWSNRRPNSPPWSYRNSPPWPYCNSPPWSYCNSLITYRPITRRLSIPKTTEYCRGPKQATSALQQVTEIAVHEGKV